MQITSKSIHLNHSTNSTLLALMLVDLSNTAVWKHKETNTIILKNLGLIGVAHASFAGEIKIGFLSAVDSTNGDFNQIANFDFTQVPGADLIQADLNLDKGLVCKTNQHFGPVIANSVLFQDDVNLAGPDDPTTITYPSGNGDLVAIVDGDGTNAIDFSINLGYDTI